MRIIAEVDLSTYYQEGKTWLYNTIKNLHKPVYADDERLVFFLNEPDTFEYDDDKGEIETCLDEFLAEIDIPEFFVIKRFSGGKNIPVYSDTKCMRPWTHLYMDPVGNIAPCCLVTGDCAKLADFNTVEEAMNSSHMKNIRKSMLENKKPRACTVCYEREKLGAVSWRSSEDRTGQEQLFANTAPDGSLSDITIAHMSIGFDSICNFKCRICHNELSSRVEEEDAVLGQIYHPITKNRNQATYQSFYHSIKDHLTGINSFHFFGGEPLLTAEHYEVLDKLIAENNDVLLRYHSNMSVLQFKQKRIIDYWNKFKNVIVHVSLDGAFEQGEYARYGTRWLDIVSNIRTVKAAAPHVNLHVDTTVSVYNCLHVTTLHRYLLDEGLFTCEDIDLHDGRGDFNDARMIPIELKQKLATDIDLFVEYIRDMPGSEKLISNYYEILKYITSKDMSYLIPKFLERTAKIDAYRGQNFFDVFPEMKLMLEFKGS